MEILVCALVASYLVAASFALVRNWSTGNHGMRRFDGLATLRVVVEALVWPLEELWLQLRQYFSVQWQAAQPRWQEVGR